MPPPDILATASDSPDHGWALAGEMPFDSVELLTSGLRMKLRLQPDAASEDLVRAQYTELIERAALHDPIAQKENLVADTDAWDGGGGGDGGDGKDRRPSSDDAAAGTSDAARPRSRRAAVASDTTTPKNGSAVRFFGETNNTTPVDGAARKASKGSKAARGALRRSSQKAKAAKKADVAAPAAPVVKVSRSLARC